MVNPNTHYVQHITEKSHQFTGEYNQLDELVANSLYSAEVAEGQFCNCKIVPSKHNKDKSRINIELTEDIDTPVGNGMTCKLIAGTRILNFQFGKLKKI